MDILATRGNGLTIIPKDLEDDGSIIALELHEGEDAEFDKNTDEKRVASMGGNENLEPYVGMEFESEDAAKLHYNSYARLVGFSTRVSVSYRSKRDGTLISRQLVCSKEGFRPKKDDNFEAKRPRREVTRVGCKAMIMIKRQDCGKWVVSKIRKEHNHELATPDKVHCLRSHRRPSGMLKRLSHTLQGVNIHSLGSKSMLIRELEKDSNIDFGQSDSSDYLQHKSSIRDAQAILTYLKKKHAENTSFFYAVHGDENCVSAIFWADARSRKDYEYFGDAVLFETNQLLVPFSSFMGLNHHGEPVLFGCALSFDGIESSFVWLFKVWLEAMSGRHPVSITTDQGRYIQEVVAQILPKTRHRFYKLNILRKCQEKLSHVYLMHPSFQGELHRCINMIETVDDFESCWASLLENYGLRNNEWLQSLYTLRYQWIPIYLRDKFFGDLFVTEGSECSKLFFDGYVKTQDTTEAFVAQYEKAIKFWREKEIKEDYDTRSTKIVFKTSLPMEKQAAKLYTRKTFAKFQEELAESLVHTANKVEENGSISNYRVAKFEVDNKLYTVMFNDSDMKAKCSCQMFEFSGIPCRHILTILHIRNVLMLPAHYVLKRWTRSARSDLELDELDPYHIAKGRESHALRYSNLRHEAIKYAEQGTTSTEIYNISMRALQEASEKVASAKKNGPIVPHEDGEEDANKGTDRGVRCGSYQSQLQDDDNKKRIRELTIELERATEQCANYREQLRNLRKRSRR